MMTTGRVIRAGLPLLALAVLAGGCAGVRRELTVESNPPGALVYLNGDEVGRTPMRKAFVWYGTYDVQLRKEGYRTLDAETKVWAPWWQIPPIDLLAEVFPLTDRHRRSYTLTPEPAGGVDKPALIDRAAQLGSMLESSEVRSRRAPAEPTE